MSTRCQVTVTQKGLEWKDKVTLYHHTDGYPENMLPLIKEAWDKYHSRTFKWDEEKKHQSTWECGRAGKVAGLLCCVDPYVFEPESGHKLHGDIEYYYVLYCCNHNHGSMAEQPIWEIEVLEPLNGFWDKPTRKNLKVLLPRTTLDKAIVWLEQRSNHERMD